MGPKDPIALLADDSAQMRTLFTEVITNAGFECVVARDGKAALEMIESGIEPTLLITDLEMPYMNGAQLIKRLQEHERFKSIPTLLLSSSGETERIAKSLGVPGIEKKDVHTLTEFLSQLIQRIS